MSDETPGVTGKRILLAIIFFPITIYFILGICAFFVLYLVDRLIHFLTYWAPFSHLCVNIDAKDDPWANSVHYFHKQQATKWHTHNMRMILFTPLTWPLLALYLFLFLLFEIVVVVMTIITKILRSIWRVINSLLTGIFKGILNTMREIWGLIQSVFGGRKGRRSDRRVRKLRCAGRTSFTEGVRVKIGPGVVWLSTTGI